MAHCNNPWSNRAVNLFQIGLEPLVLLIGLVIVNAAIDVAKGTTVGDFSFVFLRECLVAGEISGKWPLGAVSIIGLTIESDEMCQSVIKRVPEVADATSLRTRVPETVLVSSEVPIVKLSQSPSLPESGMEYRVFLYLWEGGQL
jgi:hypothetical protein